MTSASVESMKVSPTNHMMRSEPITSRNSSTMTRQVVSAAKVQAVMAPLARRRRFSRSWNSRSRRALPASVGGGVSAR